MQPSPLPPIKRYITTHDESGRSILSKELSPESSWTSPGPDAKFCLEYCTSEFPVDFTDERDIKIYSSFLKRPPGLVVSGGTTLRVVDLAPGLSSPLHRTVSLDYGVVLEGEVVLILDSGEEQLCKRGDIVVQRLTNHAWKNASDTDWARMLFVLTEAKALSICGKTLEEELVHM